jgi:hypothetical protein
MLRIFITRRGLTLVCWATTPLARPPAGSALAAYLPPAERRAACISSLFRPPDNQRKGDIMAIILSIAVLSAHQQKVALLTLLSFAALC